MGAFWALAAVTTVVLCLGLHRVSARAHERGVDPRRLWVPGRLAVFVLPVSLGVLVWGVHTYGPLRGVALAVVASPAPGVVTGWCLTR